MSGILFPFLDGAISRWFDSFGLVNRYTVARQTIEGYSLPTREWIGTTFREKLINTMVEFRLNRIRRGRNVCAHIAQFAKWYAQQCHFETQEDLPEDGRDDTTLAVAEFQYGPQFAGTNGPIPHDIILFMVEEGTRPFPFNLTPVPFDPYPGIQNIITVTAFELRETRVIDF